MHKTKHSKTPLALALLALVAFAAPAGAQTEAAAPSGKSGAMRTTAPAPAKASKQQRTAKSLDCSKQADTKNIHGKERTKFMRSCKKA